MWTRRDTSATEPRRRRRRAKRHADFRYGTRELGWDHPGIVAFDYPDEVGTSERWWVPPAKSRN